MSRLTILVFAAFNSIVRLSILALSGVSDGALLFLLLFCFGCVVKIGALGCSEEEGADVVGGGGVGPEEEGRKALVFGFRVEDKDPEEMDEKVQTDSEENIEDDECPVPLNATFPSAFGTSNLGLL